MSDFFGQKENSDVSDILITRKHTIDYLKHAGLKKVLSIEHLWGITVGIVASGLFFGWNKALNYVDPLGLLLLVIILGSFFAVYCSFVSKLAVAYPYAGAGYAYTRKSAGKLLGFLAGSFKIVQLFCMSAVLLSYLNLYIKVNYPSWFDFTLLIIFAVLISIQHIGVKEASTFQYVITCINVSIFMMFVMGIKSTGIIQFQPAEIWQSGLNGIIMALPFIMWLFLGLDVFTLSAEETKYPAKNIPENLLASLMTIALLIIATLLISLSSISWQKIVFGSFPLISILEHLQHGDKVLLAVFAFLSLSGFVAGINGVIFGYSRQIFALGRAGYLPQSLGRITSKTKVPYCALLSCLAVLLLVELVDVIFLTIIACIFALLSYILILVSYIKIMSQDIPKKPVFQGLPVYSMLFIFFVLLIAIAFFNLIPTIIAIFITALLLLYYFLLAKNCVNNNAPEEVEANTEDINIIITFLKKGEQSVD